MGCPDPRQPVASFHPSSNALGLGQWEFWGGPESRPLKAYDNVLGSFLSMDHLGKRSTERQRVGATSLFRNERSGESHTFLLEYNVFSVVRDATSFLHSLPPRQGPLGRPKAFVTCSSPAMTSRYTELTPASETLHCGPLCLGCSSSFCEAVLNQASVSREWLGVGKREVIMS